jgi:phytanoyl-CoA hydroxylase
MKRMLSTSEQQQLREDGYVVVADVFDPARDFTPVFAEYDRVLDGIAQQLIAAGQLSQSYAGLDFGARLIAICRESRQAFPQHFDISLPQHDIRPDTPIHVGPAVFDLLAHPRLLDLVEAVIGPEIYSNPIQHLRAKLPRQALADGYQNGLVTKIPWHQDNGVLLPEADEATILTVWFPLTRATIANGCLQVIPGSHREGLTTHCPEGGTVAIPRRSVEEARAVALPMAPGSVLLMHQRTIHSSLENTTADEVRISFDLRYQPSGQPSGRPQFPGFVARSRRDPACELRDPQAWAQSWYEALARLAAAEASSFNRWDGREAVCA